MARSNPGLWRRLVAFEVSPPGRVFSFTSRLARENGWSLAFARLVFEEYRRFLYLSVVVGRPLTAADAIERVWQLHLSYSASYGQGLCRQVLGRRLRYEPREGAERAAGHRAALKAYKREFGAAPPAEIWPAPDRRLPAAADGAARAPRRAGRKGARLPAVPIMPAARRA